MGPADRSRRARRQSLVALLLALGALLAYTLLPDSSELSAALEAEDGESADDEDKLEILSVSPHDPYLGGTIAIRHTPSPFALGVYAGKTELRVLARRGEQIVAALPRDLTLGDLKIRVATAPGKEADARSKPFHVRVRAPSYKKLFRHLLGGAALVVLGIFFLSRGVRATLSLHAARLIAQASKRRSVLLGMGALLGTLAQTTTGAIGLLSGLYSSRALALVPAAIACLTVPLGASTAPLLVAGLVEPRDGLLLVAIGVISLLLLTGRRSQAVAGLLLGAGLVAFGIQVVRPTLEPIFSDAAVWSLANELRADGPLSLLACAGLGALATAVMHGPAPLVVLLLGVAQATHRGDLPTLLALLAGTNAGAGLAALITVPASPAARTLAKVELVLGVLGSLLALLTVDAWTFVTEQLMGPLSFPLHWTQKTPVAVLGVRMFVGFGFSQLWVALLLTPLVPRLCSALSPARGEPLPGAVSSREAQRTLDRVLLQQKVALAEATALGVTGERRRGEQAERALAEARSDVEGLIDCPRPAPLELPSYNPLGSVAFALLQVQNALDRLLQQTERMVDARVVRENDACGPATEAFRHANLLRELEGVLHDSLEAARKHLAGDELLDLDAARTREIRMNRIEAELRGQLVEATPAQAENHALFHVLPVVDAYEVSGNQVYRLAELLCPTHRLLALSTRPV